MDKTLPLARSEGDNKLRRTAIPTEDKLLATGGSSIPSRASNNRNERKKTTTTKQKAKGRKAKDTSPKGKIGAKAKDPDGSTTKQGRPRLYDKDRKPDRGTEGADKVPRRSSAELGIEWIGSSCPDGQPHFLVDRNNFGGGIILICRNCKKSIWLPTIINEAARLDRMIDRLGTTQGYCKYLDTNRDAKMLVAKLQDLWRAKQRMENNEDFVKLVISVMEDKEYDRVQ